MKKNIKLSIVIVSYNTKEILLDCLDSLSKVRREVKFEVFVSDNGSVDGSVTEIKKYSKSHTWVRLIDNKKNIGFSRGNNVAKPYCSGEYVLFLNSDTVVKKNTLRKTVEYLETHEDVGSITCKTVLPNGELDKDVRRSFPTPWVAFTHIVLPLDKVFPKSRLFSKYWYGYKSENEIHEIDVVQGAFHLTRKKILDDVGWFDEDYFLDGEDIDLCWRIKQKGWKVIYYPKVSIIHIKKASKKNPSKENRKKFVIAGTESMEKFYRKRLWDRYPKPLNLLVISGVNIIKLIRIIRLSLS